MAKLPELPGRAVVCALERAGFEVTRVKGSHHILKKQGHRFALSVPVHGNKAVKKGTLSGLIRDAGLTVEEFLALLQ